NWAGLYKLPIIYICENNEYAISCHVSETHAVKENIADWADGYGIPNCVVDGNDVLLMHEVVKEAVERAKCGEGPTFIEAQTFRSSCHSEGYSYYYVDVEILQNWKDTKDPITNFAAKLMFDKVVTEEDLEHNNKESEAEIAE